jgi:hypothetical protein
MHPPIEKDYFRNSDNFLCFWNIESEKYRNADSAGYSPEAYI